MYKSKIFQRVISVGTAFAVAVTANFVDVTGSKTAEADAAEKTSVNLVLEPDSHSVFNDTDGDGWGEFQGFGTSLCWWANRVGYDETLTKQAAKYFYSLEDGLGMTIGRYNIGGGDDPEHDHIKRSDSAVPGYATDVTKITAEADAAGFDQYDLECGYAWNYDWDADKNQLNVLKAAVKEAGSDFIAEAFSNSPPYFMTNSGCSSGGVDGAENLRKDSYTAFAKYLTDVTAHLREEGLPVQSLTGMNEPDSGWAAYSPKQEGCRIAQGESQSDLITALSSQMKEKGLENVILSGCEEMSTTLSTKGYKALSDEAKNAISRIDSHAYSATKAVDLRTLAEAENKNLWMSEMDGTTTKGSNAGEMSSALGLGYNIATQVNALLPSAWIIWDALDIHVDKNNPFDKDTLEEANYSSLDKNGFWGVVVADHNNKEILLTKKYYAFGQYSKFIRPGYTFLTTGGNHVAAYDKKSKTLVLVVDHTEASDTSYSVDLSHFGAISSDAGLQVVRTSGTLKDGENWADISDQGSASLDKKAKKLTATVKGNSITTYVITGISLAEERDLQEITIPQPLPADSVLKEAMDSLYDGSFYTGYSRTKKKTELVVDLGDVYKLSGVAYAAFTGAADAIEGGSFYTSTDGKNWTKLYDVSVLPSTNHFNYIFSEEFADSKAAYARYIKATGTQEYCSLGELKAFGTVAGSIPEEEEKPKTIGTVTLSSVKSKKKNTAVVSWKKVKGVDGYRITYAQDKAMKKGKKTVKVKGANITSKTIKKLKSGKNYYFKVQAYQGSSYGKDSKVCKVKIK